MIKTCEDNIVLRVRPPIFGYQSFIPHFPNPFYSTIYTLSESVAYRFAEGSHTMQSQPSYTPTTSEVARFREQQALQEEAAKRSLHGYTIVSSHDMIDSRMEREAGKIVKLFQEGHIIEALAIMESPNWKG